MSKLGPKVKPAGAVRRVPLSLKVPPALRKSMEEAADRSGRSLCAEVEYRIQEYELLRKMFDILGMERAEAVVASDEDRVQARHIRMWNN